MAQFIAQFFLDCVIRVRAEPSRIFSCILLLGNQMTFLVQFPVFFASLKKFTRAHLFQIALEIM